MTELESYVHLIPIDYLIQKIEVRYAHDIVRGRLEVFPGAHPMVRYYPEGVKRLLEDFSHLTVCETRFFWDGEGFFDHGNCSTDFVPPDPILLRVVIHFPFHLHVVRITYLYTMTPDNLFRKHTVIHYANGISKQFNICMIYHESGSTYQAVPIGIQML